MSDMYGRQTLCKVNESFIGQVQGDMLVMQGQYATLEQNGVVQQLPTDSMNVQFEGSELIGNASLSDGSTLIWRAGRMQ